MDSSGLLRSLRRHARLVVVVTIASVLLAVLVSALIPRTYTAKATLFLRVQAASATLTQRSQFALERIQSFPQLLESPQLLRGVIAKLDLTITPQQLAEHLSAVVPTNTVLLEVSAEAGDPRQAATLANAAATALATDVNTLENSETNSRNAVMLVPRVVAQAPSGPSTPNVPAILGLGLLAGLVAGLLAALGLERWRPRLLDAEDVRRVTGLPLVAQLGPARRDGPVVGGQTAASSLRALGRGSIAESIVLAPAGPPVADHAVLHELARGIADTGRRVAVVGTTSDGDDAADGPGLAELLAGTVSADDVIAARTGEVDVIVAGDPDVLPSGLAIERSFASAVRPVVDAHDVTLLQSAMDDGPVDLTITARGARWVIIVASRRTTTEQEVRRVQAALRSTEVRPIGVVLTDGRPIATIDLATSWLEDDFVTAEPAAQPESEPSDVVRALRRPRRIDAAPLIRDEAPESVRGER
ncbi:Wzz/FepE/Etk N-terminal domain-containing protein [Amnibacterium kyonggiense]|uniref:Capsular polysaccharide biosynthesis protein n=1 Tax=Amnibacterium kyonggiense TaxID=595671 RepID=A0A4R7FIQ7_9MICO|nr:Wzz/FepE/Etk N-terminal domain-containing protein [Amnibacterium kyonggiense]TDS74938.1 capsular polysaccharide biosynthesis protein [Amnibacterium kyonggiense]